VPSLITPTASPVLGPAGHSVEFRKANFGLNNSVTQADALFVLPATDPGVNSQAFDNGVATINYLDSGYSPSFLFPAPRDVGSLTFADTTTGHFNDFSEDDNFAMKSSGFIYIPQAGAWNFTVASDDGFRLVMGENNAVVAEFDGGRPLAPTTGQAFVATPGYYHYELTWDQGAGGAACAFSANGPGQATDKLVGDPTGTLQVFQAPAGNIVTPAANPSLGPAGNHVEFRKANFNLNNSL